MTPPLDPKTSVEFQKAIVTRDIARARAALDAGADPSTPIGRAGFHPLELLLTANYESFLASAAANGAPFTEANKPTKEQFNQRGAEIIDLLLERGLKLVTTERYVRNPVYPVDNCLMSQNLENLSKVIIHTVSESLEKNNLAYKLDPLGFLDGYLFNAMSQQPGSNPEQHGAKAMKILEAVHDAVGKHLKDPQTDAELDLVTNHREAVAHWMQPFDRPPLSSILAPQAMGPQGGGMPMPQQPGMAAPAGAAMPMPAPGRGGDPFFRILAEKTPEEVMSEIDGMVGMGETKNDAKSLAFRAQFEAARNAYDMKSAPQVANTVFEGGAGSGKTTAARHQAELLHALGLSGNKYAEINYENIMLLLTDRNGAAMMNLFSQADIIFIDEVSNLTSAKYGMGDIRARLAYLADALTEAVETRGEKLTVFLSGTEKDINEFFAQNPVLKSHITHYQHLPNYSPEQMGQIMDRQLADAGLKMDADARVAAIEKLQAKSGSNTRAIRSLLEQLPDKMAERLFGQASSKVAVMPKKEDLSTVTKADIEAVVIMASEKGSTLGFESKTPSPSTSKPASSSFGR